MENERKEVANRETKTTMEYNALLRVCLSVCLSSRLREWKETNKTLIAIARWCDLIQIHSYHHFQLPMTINEWIGDSDVPLWLLVAPPPPPSQLWAGSHYNKYVTALLNCFWGETNSFINASINKDCLGGCVLCGEGGTFEIGKIYKKIYFQIQCL